jgi:GNAT superfamily N-acetyltransferase
VPTLFRGRPVAAHGHDYHGGHDGAELVTITVEEVGDGPGLETFFSLRKTVYGDDPRHLDPGHAAELASLDRPDFRGRQRALVAREDGEPVARAVARLSPALRDPAGRPYGVIGLFEALDRPAAAVELLRAAVGRLREEGAGEVVGPMDGDTWHRYRLNVGPHDEPPFLMEPYNPAYYPEHWRAAGFEVLEEYYSKRVDDLAGAAEQLAPALDGALAAGYRLEPLRPDRFDAELGRLHRLSRRIFAGNFLYTDISERRFVALYAGSRRLVDPELVRFAVAPDGTDAGFLFALPDRFAAVAALGGRRGPLAALRFLLARRRPVDTVTLKSLGVVEEPRRSRLGSALLGHAYRTALGKGYRRANLCLIQGGNPSGRLDGGLGRVLRRYHLYRFAGLPGEG